jgi:tetratricopeptide (TPR) repeat protein
LTGSVQRMGDQIKISVELVDGRTGQVILSDTLDGSVEDIFRLQEQVASIIENSISGDSGPPLHAASEPSSYEAFAAYARGQYEFEVRDRDSIEQSISLFEETIRLDPLFGPAYLRLAYAYLLLPEYDTSISADSMYELAAATANAGVAADSSILQAVGTVFGFIHHKRGEWLSATRAFEMAVTADIVYPISHHWYSRLLASVGRLDESLVHAQRAHELDPDSAIIISRLAIANYWVDNVDMAGRYFGVVSKMTLEAPIHDLAYALFLIRKGQFGEAGIVAKRGLEKYGLPTEWVDSVFAGIEDPMKRDTAIDIIRQLAADERTPRYIPMILWALLDDADSAMQVALTIENPGQGFESEVVFIHELQNVRAHEDFPLLLSHLGLDDYSDAVGCKWVDGDAVCSVPD